MVSVVVKKNKNKYLGFTCIGHAEYDEYGRDIVCGALSILVINTINAINTLTKCRIVVTEDAAEGKIVADFPDGASKEAELLMEAMILGIKGVIEEYGKEYASIVCKEV